MNCHKTDNTEDEKETCTILVKCVTEFID